MYLSIKSLASWIVVGLCLFLITSVQELRFLFDLDRIARKFERKGREGIPAIFLRHYPAYKNKQLNVSELARVCDISRTTALFSSSSVLIGLASFVLVLFPQAHRDRHITSAKSREIVFFICFPSFKCSCENVIISIIDLSKTILTFYNVHFKYYNIFITNILCANCSILYMRELSIWI